MKKFAFLMMATVFSVSALMAQPPGGGQRLTVEQRVDNVLKEAKSLNLDAAKIDSVKAIFTQYYTTQQTQMEAIRNSGQRPDMETMRANNEKLSGERDTRLKAILTADEWKQWEKKVAPGLNQRPGGGRAGGPGGPRGNF